jgi:hypothetical protein
MKYIKKIFEDETPKTGGMSDEWKANCIDKIKRGKTLNDESLSKMGKNDIIVKYFPTADPNFKDFKRSDIGKYLKNNKELNQQVKSKVNQQIQEQVPKKLAGSRYSKKVDVAGFDAGYLNADYTVTLTSAKVLSFNETSVTGTGNFKIYCSIPDGVLEGASKSININAKFTANYSYNIEGENVVVTIIPKSIILNSPKYTIIADTGMQIINNKVKIIWGTYLRRNLGSSIVYTADPISELRKTMGKDVSFTIPKDSLRISMTPNNPAEVKKTAYKLVKNVKMN